MGRNNYFQFKKFRIIQEKSAMKVGIDGVLLGAWINLNGADQVLDIGTGTGLLALMAAQRSDAIIDAVELEPDAASEALLNFENSGWKSRINLSVGAFQVFKTNKKYDHILSNPPFFENSSKSNDLKRTQARHSDSLTLRELLVQAKEMLAENGKISLILPIYKEKQLFDFAKALGFYVTRFTTVSPDETKKPHRILIELSMVPSPMETFSFSIRDSGFGDFSDQYRDLTREFYLAF